MEEMKDKVFRGFFEAVTVRENGAVWGGIRVNDPVLKGIVKKHYRKFKHKLEWDEYIGSAMTFTWLQMQNFDGDWDAILEGDSRERKKLFRAISQSVYNKTLELANPNSKRMNHENTTVSIKFESLDREVAFDDFVTTVGETQELESFFAVREYRKTPFTKWLDENQADIFTDKQLDFFIGMRSCLDNSKEEVEAKTGLPQSRIPKDLQRIKKKVEKYWNRERGFENTYIYEDITEEQEALNAFLDIEEVADVLEQARLEMSNNSKIGDVLVDGLDHGQLQAINGRVHDRKLAYAVNALLIKRLSNTETFIENERVLWNKRNEESIQSVKSKHFNYRDEIEMNGPCKVYKDGMLIGEFKENRALPVPVRLIDGYGVYH